MSTLKRLSKNLITAVLSLVFVFQYAFAFDPTAEIKWNKQGSYPYNWVYTGTIYVNKPYSDWKGNISGTAFAFDAANNEIAGTMSTREVFNVSNVTLGHAAPSMYNNSYLAAMIYGVVTAGTLSDSVDETAWNGVPGIKSRNMLLYSQMRNAAALRGELLVKSFDADISNAQKYALFDYLNMNWKTFKNGLEFLDTINLKMGDSGLLLYESPEKDCIQIFKQDCNDINHKYEFAINEGYISLISYETTASTTTPELKQEIQELKQALNEATYN